MEKTKKVDKVNPVRDYQNKEELQREQISNGVNQNRRNLLKFLLIGSGALLLGKIFGPGLLKFFSPLLLPQAKALAATYYLDAVNGNDSNPGTSEQPWKTIQRAQPDWTGGGNKVVSGDTVEIKNGTYSPFKIPISYTGTDWITYKAAEGHMPIILGKSGIGGWPPPAKDYFIRFDGLKFLVSEPLAPGENLVWVYAAKNIEFLNCHIVGAGYIMQNASRGLYFTDCNTVKIDHCTFYGVSDVNETPWKGNDDAINARCSHNFIITNNEFTNNGAAIRLWGRNYLISNNNIHDMGFEGIVGGGVANVIIEDNIIHDIAIHGDCIQFFSAGGIFPGNPSYVFNENIIIRRNILYNSFLGQLMLWNGFIPEEPNGPGMENVLVENNLIYGAGAWDVFVSDTNDLKFRNNSVVGKVGGQYIGNSGRARFSNCKITEFRNNIIHNFVFDGGTILSNEDYNIFYFFGDGEEQKEWTPGAHTLTLTSENQYRALFKNIDSNNYYPAYNSSAINFCPKEGAPDTDVLGNPRDAQPDAGAYEYISSTPPPPPPPPPPSILYGDVSGDGSITAYDAALTAQAAVGLITLTPEQTKAADVSGNGEVSAYDAALIAQKAVGLIDKFPVE